MSNVHGPVTLKSPTVQMNIDLKTNQQWTPPQMFKVSGSPSNRKTGSWTPGQPLTTKSDDEVQSGVYVVNKPMTFNDLKENLSPNFAENTHSCRQLFKDSPNQPPLKSFSTSASPQQSTSITWQPSSNYSVQDLNRDNANNRTDSRFGSNFGYDSPLPEELLANFKYDPFKPVPFQRDLSRILTGTGNGFDAYSHINSPSSVHKNSKSSASVFTKLILEQSHNNILLLSRSSM